ncbi:hypothetical protein FLJC2902T_00510 [Flavobacterium limnosediminis JC2902]|uniref:Secretion system C-terminal sorting domain-containing protein n=1 Tax=Flavobacterium limnosediminis JC2902 TaxID=1341181 RepID=V6SSA2_9FLAO|nr:choice-of-anchor J domain-containing protein [Flavobacterium limnosediminis]ESU29583.1 hypothetical protein FLJC2902T_00510 [Flavobacterium limnosediminis JC2902]
MRKKLLLLGFGFASVLVNGQNLFNFGFDGTTASMIAAGWQSTNQSSPVGAGTWQNAAFTLPLTGPIFGSGNTTTIPVGQAGGNNSFALVNYTSTTGAGTISNWLITPNINVMNGDVITFWSRKGTDGTTDYPDRLELRMSTAASTVVPSGGSADLGSFTTLALTINPTLAAGFVYPKVWTQYSYTVTGVPTATNVKFAFRYFVTNGGPSGANSDIIGIDSFSVNRTMGTNDFFAENFSIFPNPASSVLNFSTKNSAQIEAIQILDLNGRIVKTNVLNGVSEAQVNVSELNSGVYFVDITSSEGKATTKFVKN